MFSCPSIIVGVIFIFFWFRYEHGGWWPNLRESNFDHVGSGHGLGYNCNIPLNKVREASHNCDGHVTGGDDRQGLPGSLAPSGSPPGSRVPARTRSCLCWLWSCPWLPWGRAKGEVFVQIVKYVCVEISRLKMEVRIGELLFLIFFVGIKYAFNRSRWVRPPLRTSFTPFKPLREVESLLFWREAISFLL